MDLTTIDVTALADAVRVGDWVELFGPQVPIEDVAELAGTNTYEILTGLGVCAANVGTLADGPPFVPFRRERGRLLEVLCSRVGLAERIVRLPAVEVRGRQFAVRQRDRLVVVGNRFVVPVVAVVDVGSIDVRAGRIRIQFDRLVLIFDRFVEFAGWRG